ncbi:MAG: F0F1 ATP synthase subunit delta [Steroidobacteraceae bacterium]
MADKTTIARPYAKAAFEEARGENRLGPWSEAMRAAATVVTDPRVETLLGNPRVTAGELAQLVIDIAGQQLGDHGANFVRTLADNHRLACLPEISARFDELKDAAEKIVDVTVTSAAPLDDTQRKTLATALERKLQRAIRMQCHTDPSLIGGAVLQAGDLVIDGSLRTQLNRITYELTA